MACNLLRRGTISPLCFRDASFRGFEDFPGQGDARAPFRMCCPQCVSLSRICIARQALVVICFLRASFPLQEVGREGISTISHDSCTLRLEQRCISAPTHPHLGRRARAERDRPVGSKCGQVYGDLWRTGGAISAYFPSAAATRSWIMSG